VHELGDLLFAAVNVARLAGIDPELALRAASGRFRQRVERAEALAGDAGQRFSALTLDQQDAWYRLAKQELARG
jgi:ATP diphosphatase